MDFADKLQGYRKQRGMSQENLAEVIGVSRQAVSKWESGQSYPEMDKMIALSEFFGVSMDHMVKEVSGNQEAVLPLDAGNFHSDVTAKYHYEYKSKRTLFGIPWCILMSDAEFMSPREFWLLGILPLAVCQSESSRLAAYASAHLQGDDEHCRAGSRFSSGHWRTGRRNYRYWGSCRWDLRHRRAVHRNVLARRLCDCFADRHRGLCKRTYCDRRRGQGAYTILVEQDHFSSIQAEQVRGLINQEYPRLWKPVAEGIIAIFE